MLHLAEELEVGVRCVSNSPVSNSLELETAPHQVDPGVVWPQARNHERHQSRLRRLEGASSGLSELDRA